MAKQDLIKMLDFDEEKDGESERHDLNHEFGAATNSLSM